MCKTVDNKKDVLLLLLYSPGRSEEVNEPIIGRTRLVKTLFLFLKECLPHFKRGTRISEENFYEFFAWDYGPFSKQIYDDIVFFTLRGFIDADVSEAEVLPEAAAEWGEWMRMSSPEEDDSSLAEYDEQVFRLSEKGLKFAEGLYGSLTSDQKTTLETFKARLNGMPLKAILRYVYETYPDFTTRSRIREQLLGHL